jgi:site-specific DNA recombinase
MALSDPRTKDKAFGIIRTLIDEVRMVPEDRQLRIELRGALGPTNAPAVSGLE